MPVEFCLKFSPYICYSRLTKEHEEEIKRLKEEMEMLQLDKEKTVAEEKAKEQQLREKLQKEITDKEQKLGELLQKHSEMEQKLEELDSQDTYIKSENQKLAEEREEEKKSREKMDKEIAEKAKRLEELEQEHNQMEEKLEQLNRQESEIKIENENLLMEKAKEQEEREKKDKVIQEKDNRLQELQDKQRELEEKLEELSQKDMAIRDENEKLAQEKESERQMREVMDKEIIEKNQQLERMEQMHKEMEEKLQKLNMREAEIQAHNVKLLEEKEELDKMVTASQAHLEDSKEYISQLKGKQREDSRTKAMSAMTLAENIALERESLVQELEMYRSGTLPRATSSESEFDIHGARPGPIGENRASEHIEKYTNEEIASKSPERVFKVVFVGDSGVGKSSFIHRFCNSEFKSTFSATIGVDFQVKNMLVEDHIIALQLWDTAGQERFRSITKQYFRKADGVLIMYDVTSETSYKNVRNWMVSVQDGTEESTVLAVVGNKMDLVEDEDTRPVKSKDGVRLADDYGALFYETSAKSNLNVYETLHGMASLLREREDEELEKALNLSDEVEKKKGCCN